MAEEWEGKGKRTHAHDEAHSRWCKTAKATITRVEAAEALGAEACEAYRGGGVI